MKKFHRRCSHGLDFDQGNRRSLSSRFSLTFWPSVKLSVWFSLKHTQKVENIFLWKLFHSHRMSFKIYRMTDTIISNIQHWKTFLYRKAFLWNFLFLFMINDWRVFYVGFSSETFFVQLDFLLKFKKILNKLNFHIFPCKINSIIKFPPSITKKLQFPSIFQSIIHQHALQHHFPNQGIIPVNWFTLKIKIYFNKCKCNSSGTFKC